MNWCGRVYELKGSSQVGGMNGCWTGHGWEGRCELVWEGSRAGVVVEPGQV